MGAGVIDADFQGTIKVLLFNHSDTPFDVHAGDRIAQLILERILISDGDDVQGVADLNTTARGSKGFGSSGLRWDGIYQCQDIPRFPKKRRKHEVEAILDTGATRSVVGLREARRIGSLQGRFQLNRPKGASRVFRFGDGPPISSPSTCLVPCRSMFRPRPKCCVCASTW